jgi:hypothetical protein
MMRQLAELDLPASGRRRHAPRASVRVIVTLLVWVLIIAGVAWAAGVGRSSSHSNSSTQPGTAGTVQDLVTHTNPQSLASGDPSAPPIGVGELQARPLPPAVAPAGSGGYKFLNTTGGQPVGYDPCRPIHYVIRDQATPAGGDNAVHQAIAAVSKATGLAFVDDGMTTETPALPRTPYQPARYGKRWAPVLLAWTDPTEVPQLAGPQFGVAQSYARVSSQGSGPAYVTGIVYLDASDLGSRAPATQEFTLQSVIEHELGHLVGLDHVTDPKQLMYPKAEGEHGYAAGDLRGLALEGSGSCHPEL